MEIDDKMETRSFYVNKKLYERLQNATKRTGASLIIGYLIEMWLDRKIKLEFEPEEDETL